MATIKNITDGLKVYDKNDEIVIAWWDKEWFEDILDRELDDEDWQIILYASDKVLEYSDLGDQLISFAEQALDEEGREVKPRKKEVKPRKKKKEKK